MERTLHTLGYFVEDHPNNKLRIRSYKIGHWNRPHRKQEERSLGLLDNPLGDEG